MACEAPPDALAGPRTFFRFLGQKSAAADIKSQLAQANLQAEADKTLAEQGLQSALMAKKSEVAAEQLAISGVAARGDRAVRAP